MRAVERMLVLSALTAIVSASPTAATMQSQPGATPQTGTLIQSAPPASVEGTTTTAAREANRQFGVCVVSHKSAMVARVLELPVDHPEFYKTLQRLATDDCLAFGELRLPPLLLRGSIFEASYFRQFGRSFIADLSMAPAFDYTSTYRKPLSELASNAIALALVGDCVTRADSSSVRLLLTSKPGTPSENRAIGALASRLPGCIPKGQTIRFSKSVIRAANAEALYRLSVQARQAQAAQKAVH